MTNLSTKAIKFIAKNPTHIGSVAGFHFYEHPIYGDEHPLIMITPEGKLVKSEYYELPTIQEFADGNFNPLH